MPSTPIKLALAHKENTLRKAEEQWPTIKHAAGNDR